MKSVVPSALSMTAIVCLLAGPALAAGTGHDHGSMSGMSDDMAGMMTEMEGKMADTSAFGHTGEAAQITRTVAIEAADFSFDVSELNFKVGETVRFVIVNNGEQPHEFTIGDASYQETARRAMRHMTEMGMDPVAPEHAAIHASAGNTVTLDVGETKEIVWTFANAGTFAFSCNLIGHSEAGMKGGIVVTNNRG